MRRRAGNLLERYCRTVLTPRDANGLTALEKLPKIGLVNIITNL